MLPVSSQNQVLYAQILDTVASHALSPMLDSELQTACALLRNPSLAVGFLYRAPGLAVTLAALLDE